MSRRVTLAAIAAIAIISAGIGWIAGQQIKSPADVAAEAEAPEPSLITVPVEFTALSSNVIVRGQVEFSESTDITVSASEDGVAIVTRLPKAEGDDIDEGDVLVEVAGRPVFALQGDLPAFRSLTPGLVGPDVRQLEEALIRVGLDPGTVDETYSEQTEQAVAELYRSAGYDADEPTLDDLERLESARRSVRSAEDALRDAQASGGDGLPRSQQLELDRQIRAAQEAYNQAIRDRDDAVAAAVADRDAASAAIGGLDAAVTRAARRLAAAEDGTHPDTGVAPTDAELAELAQAVADAEAEAEAGRSALENAEAAIPVVTAEYDRAVTDADLDLQIQYASRDEIIAGANEGVDSTLVTQAREAVDDARSSLSRLEAEIGIGFPANELVFLSSLPSEVQTVWSEIGDIPQGPVMTVTGSGLQITSSVPTTDRSLINEGDEAVMEDDALGISLRLRVAFIADSPGGSASADRYFLRFEPLDEVPEEAYDRNFRVTLPFASTDGEVLAVPMAALSAGADGSARVEVEREDGTVETVEVIAGLNSRAQGLVEITPVDGELVEGDRVSVGRDAAGSIGTDEDGADDGGADDGGSDG